MKQPASRHYDFAQPAVVDLKRKSVIGGIAAVSAQGVKFFLQMATTMVLARLLSPKDFGLQGMVVVVIGFLALFRDAGLGMATVQRLEVTHEQTSTLFWINVAVGAILASLCAASAPLLVAFYHEPLLYWVAVVSGTTFVFNGLAAQHDALLQRDMRFVTRAKIDVLYHHGQFCDGHSHGIARLPVLVSSGYGGGLFNRRRRRRVACCSLGPRSAAAQVRHPIDAPFWGVGHL